MANRVLTQDISESLNGAKAAKIDINCGTGHLTIDKLGATEQLLARGTLQYLQKQGIPRRSANIDAGQATLALTARDLRQSGFRLPWAGCGAAYTWQIQLNPSIPSDLAVRSRGGNVKLQLAAMVVTRLSANTGGGNLAVVLPDNAANLTANHEAGAGNVEVEVGKGIVGNNTITARSGAGSVVVRLPNGVAAKISATTGMGKVIVDQRFAKIDKATYKSADYDIATTKIDIDAHSGAGNVSITTK